MSLEAKLALKDRPIRVVDPPSGFDLASGPPRPGDAALLVFVKDRAALRKQMAKIVGSAVADRLTWVAYPKGGQLGTDLNRDSLAELLQDEGAQPVTQISIDSTWSALRFRPARGK
ncbi:MAG TPA: hypothetical protein VGU43_07820 [Thermoplasmata archaeon]|nr:hypothetical protein [Thermoplasmata archaeon]